MFTWLIFITIADAGKCTVGGQILFLTKQADKAMTQVHEGGAGANNAWSWLDTLTF